MSNMAKRSKRAVPKAGRRERKREPKRRILIVCGGTVTEKEYFDQAKKDLSASAVRVVSPGKGKDPVQLVRYAAKLAKSSDPYKEVWAITDVDEFQNLDEAQKLADKEGIKLAISNPCFEVWLIDHAESCPGSCCFTAACERHARELGLIFRVGQKGKGSGKAKHVNLDIVSGRIGEALGNAKGHNTMEKKHLRANNPGATSRYTTWSDIPEVIASMSQESAS